MNKWKLYNPEGMQDILNENCYLKKNAEERMRKMFLSNGYIEIETPMIEFYDVFAASGSETAMESPFKMVDAKGRILTLRPDMTIPAARVASTKLNEEIMPAKLFYCGKCFRSGEYEKGKLREFTQSGVEIIGSSDIFYDALVISAAVDAVKTMGLNEFIIEIGQVDFFKGLMNMADLGAEDSEKIRRMIDSKDFFGVEEILIGKDLNDEVKNLLSNLPSYYGKKEMLLEVRAMTRDARLLKALDELLELLELLDDFGLAEYISVDLGMVKRLDYYTGIIFRGMTYGMGFPILGGGRYDTLCGKFGKEMPATGFSLGIDMALTALYRNNGGIPEEGYADSLVCFEKNAMKDAIMVSKALKAQDLRIEMAPVDDELNSLKAYALAKRIKGIIYIKSGGEVEIFNLAACTSDITNIEKLTGGVS